MNFQKNNYLRNNSNPFSCNLFSACKQNCCNQMVFPSMKLELNMKNFRCMLDNKILHWMGQNSHLRYTDSKRGCCFLVFASVDIQWTCISLKRKMLLRLSLVRLDTMHLENFQNQAFRNKLYRFLTPLMILNKKNANYLLN